MDAMLMKDQNHIMILRRARIETKGPPKGVQGLRGRFGNRQIDLSVKPGTRDKTDMKPTQGAQRRDHRVS